MTRFLFVLALLLVPALPASATFSIVAIDPVTGDLGIAVAWRDFAVGAVGRTVIEDPAFAKVLEDKAFVSASGPQ